MCFEKAEDGFNIKEIGNFVVVVVAVFSCHHTILYEVHSPKKSNNFPHTPKFHH